MFFSAAASATQLTRYFYSSFITFHKLLIRWTNCTKIMMNYHAQCVADDIKFIYAICSIISWIMLLKSREERRRKIYGKCFCLRHVSCLQLNYMIKKRTRKSTFFLLSLLFRVSITSFFFWFRFGSPRLLMRFSSATLIMEASDFRCSINKKKERSRLSTSSNEQMIFDTKQTQK